MVTMFLVELTDERAIYRYHPEDEEDFGIIEIDRINKECRVLKKAQKITDSEYWGQALSKAREMLSENEYPSKNMAAWY